MCADGHPPSDDAGFDVFVSHHSGDADWVAGLAAELAAQGLKVWVDRQRIRPGDRFVGALHDGLARSRCVLVVLSQGALASPWVREELDRALVLENADAERRRRTIAVLIDDAEVGGFLASRHWVDFRDPARRAESMAQLVAVLKGAAPAGHAAAGAVDAEEPRRIDYEGFLLRRIEALRRDRRRHLALRWGAPLAALALPAGALAVAPLDAVTAGAAALAAAAVAALAWGLTARPLAEGRLWLDTFEPLHDGLSICRGHSSPNCRRLRERFWQCVERLIPTPAAAARPGVST